MQLSDGINGYHGSKEQTSGNRHSVGHKPSFYGNDAYNRFSVLPHAEAVSIAPSKRTSRNRPTDFGPIAKTFTFGVDKLIWVVYSSSQRLGAKKFLR